MKVARYVATFFLVCMAVPMCAACGSVESSPKQTAQTLFTAMSKGDVETVRKYTYLRKGDKLSDSKPEQGVTDVQVDNETKSDSTGSVNVHFKVADKQENLTLSMRKDLNSKLWKADGSQLFVKANADADTVLGGLKIRGEESLTVLPGTYTASYDGGWYSGTWKEKLTELGGTHNMTKNRDGLIANDGIKTDRKILEAVRTSLIGLGNCTVLDQEMTSNGTIAGNQNHDIFSACQSGSNGISDASGTTIIGYTKHVNDSGYFTLTLGGTATASKGEFRTGGVADTINPPSGYRCENLGGSVQCAKFSPAQIDMNGIQVSINSDLDAQPSHDAAGQIGKILYADHAKYQE